MKFSIYILPSFILVTLVVAFFKRVKAYDSFLTGVKDGLKISLEMFPTMFGMYIAINMLDSSGFLDEVFKVFGKFSEYMTQAFFRPFSSQASLGLMLEVFKKYGPDSQIGFSASILQGSSDSTIFIMSLYLGSYQIVKTKRAFIYGFFISSLSFIFSLLIYLFIKI